MNPFWEIADFIRGMRRELRFGDLSRAPLRLLRLELSGKSVSCDWLARPGDIFDESLDWRQRERNVSEQALCDAIRVRDLVFETLPQVEGAVLRGFRSSEAREPPELIISGVAVREAPHTFRVSSLVMRAKLCGFQFEIKDGILQALKTKGQAVLQMIDRTHFEQITPKGKEEVDLWPRVRRKEVI